MAQAPALMQWGTYLPQWASFLASLLAVELATVSGPVIHVAQESIQKNRLQNLTLSPYEEGKGDPLADAAYIDRSGHDAALQWTVSVFQPSTKRQVKPMGRIVGNMAACDP